MKSEFCPHEELISLALKIGTSPMIGELKDKSLCMPLQDSDKRKRTWIKTILSLKIVNEPRSINDCWFINANCQDGYSTVKISRDGSRNKWRTHQITYLLLHPEDYKVISTRCVNRRLVLGHRCSRGKAKQIAQACCINPYHTSLVTPSVNESQKGCRYGAARYCPHTPICIFTDENGLYIDERNHSAHTSQ